MTDISLFSLDSDGVVQFSLVNMDKQISGPEEALQIAAYHILQNPGTNSFSRDEGGGMRRLLSKSITTKQEIQAEASIVISQAIVSIRKSQSPGKPADSTITDLRLLDVNLIREELKILMTIRIDLLDGNSFQASFRVT